MEIIAQKREELGKQNKKLRKERKIPAVVYGDEIEPTSLTIDTLNFINVYKEAGETTLIDLKFGNTDEKVLVKEVQLNPITLAPIHVSFHKVNLKEKIKANVPVEVINEENSPVVKSGEGIVILLMNEIEVEALPADLPSVFEIDASHLTEVGEGIAMSAIKFDTEKVEIVDFDPEELVAKADYAEMEEIEEEEELSEEELIAGVEATEESAEDDEEGAESGEKASAEENKTEEDSQE